MKKSKFKSYINFGKLGDIRIIRNKKFFSITIEIGKYFFEIII